MTERVTFFDPQGKKLVLGPSDHLATGGEGAVYAKGSTVYKLYLDAEKARRARLDQKVTLLQALRRPGVAAPLGALSDKNGLFVGMSFERVQGEALCRLFTNAWRNANRFDTPQTLKVVQRMRETMDWTHAHQALMVDANELNWLVEGVDPTVIDVDSWQVPGFAATAIMPSIRDPLAQAGFTSGSDWFSWGVVTFQLWTGIHPYKGTHPDFARSALQERMAARASVFDPRVSVPAAARSVDEIPPALRAWYVDVFQHGARGAPPSDFDGHAAPQTAPRLRVVQSTSSSGTSSLRQERVGAAPGRVLAAFNGFVIVQVGTKTGAKARAKTGELQAWDAALKRTVPAVTSEELVELLARRAALVRMPTGVGFVRLNPGADITLRALDAQAVQGQSALPTRAQRLWQSGNRLFALVEGVPNGLVELGAGLMGERAVLSVARQWPVAALSTTFLRGCFVQDCLGMPFLGVLEGEGLVQLRAPALSGYRVLDGLGLDRHNVWLTAVRKRDGAVVRMRLAAKGDVFEREEEDDSASAELDGAALPSGVGVLRLGDELRVSKGPHHKNVAAGGLSEDARLFCLEASLGLFEDSEVSRLSLG